MSSFDFSSYLSPFTWRYGSSEMRKVFSEQHKFELYRKIWVSLAQVQYEAGLVTKKELDDLKKQQNNIDIKRILEIEKEKKHDIVSAITEFAEKAKIGGGKIHLGATSMDIVDNTDTMRMLEGLKIVENKVKNLLKEFSIKIKKYAKTPCVAYTHLQPAEPTTLGYRFATYAQDLLIDLETLRFIKTIVRAKGLKGAVGTAASYTTLLEGNKMNSDILEKKVMKTLDLSPSIITTQVSPRKYDFLVLTILASISQSLSKFAADLRILQSPMFGEMAEPFGKKQVGSSAMPFKRNPINCEKICSLARFINQLPPIALENASLSYLERTLDDSANKRIIVPESFLAADEILNTALKIIPDMVVNEKKIAYNLAQYAPFAATELVLMRAVKRGADRQKMHEELREQSMKAWEKVQNGEKNPMDNSLLEEVTKHVGSASKRAILLTKDISKLLRR